MSKNRPDFPKYLNHLSLSQEEANDPIVILARSGGRKVTDTYELFPLPEINNQQYHIHFFVHGITHLPQPSTDRIENLQPGEILRFMHDLQNQYDPNALCLRTDDTQNRQENDLYFLGYIPRYFTEDILTLTQHADDLASAPTVKVERVNPDPAPLRFRLLCNLTAACPPGFEPFQSLLYEPWEEKYETFFI